MGTFAHAATTMNRRDLILLSSLGFLLAMAAGLQFFTSAVGRPARPHIPLVQTLPQDLPGWTSRELPLGETEETKNTIVAILKFDDYLSRVYRKGTTEVSLYVAYWRPDKVPPRAVGVHTPDTCWVENGWARMSRVHSVTLITPLGRTLKPAEFGTYSMNRNIQQVYFWHLVAGRPYSYEQEGMHSLTSPLQDMATFGLDQRRDQLFVRLASNVPFPQIWNEPGFVRLLNALTALTALDIPQSTPSGS